MSCRIQLPDGTFKSFSSPLSALELAQSIGQGLAKSTVGVLINKDPEVKDLRSVLKNGDQVELITLSSEKALEVIRHSTAHVLAQAVQNLWPEVKVTIGPVIENGFYYDFDTEKTFSTQDLLCIEEEMKSLIKKDYKVIKEVWPSEKAGLYFEKKGELLKKQIIEDLGEKEVSIYRQGDWLDLCRGPHVQNLGQIGAVKVLSQSGAYWRGDSKNKQLTRIYGTAFHSQKQLKNFLAKQELAKENDHRKIGKKLNLFWFSELSPGSPFFTPSGTVLYNRLQSFLRGKYKDYSYEEVISPQIYHSDLFKQSGHLKHFFENIYAVLGGEQLEGTGFKESLAKQEEDEFIERVSQSKTPESQILSKQREAGLVEQTEKSKIPKGQNSKGGPSDLTETAYDEEIKLSQDFSSRENQVLRGMQFLKPMNCPGHCLLYNKDRRSYKDLPWRVADFGRLHRREPAGSLQGLTRVKSFCQDDAHIFVVSISSLERWSELSPC